MRILRVLKGIATSAAIWGAAWIPLTVALSGVAALFGMPQPPRELWGLLLLRQGIAGALNGAVFGATLAVLGRRRAFESLHYGLFAVSGAIGGAVFPLLMTGLVATTTSAAIPFQAIVFSTAMSAFLGTVCAVESLRLARQAPALPSVDGGEERRLVSHSA